MKTKIATSLVLTLAFLVLGSVAFAAVPDYLECDEQPSIIYASMIDGEPGFTELTVQLMATYENGNNEPVRQCGVEIVCESQNTDILVAEDGSAIARDTTDEFGRVYLRFKSVGHEVFNLGTANVICRSLQVDSDTCSVTVERQTPKCLATSVCPKAAADKHGPPAFNILADGDSKVYVTAQLLDQDSLPVKEEGVEVTFTVDNTDIIYNAEPLQGSDIHRAVVETNEFGVATAVFTSRGSGTENTGTAQIHVTYALGCENECCKKYESVTTYHEMGVTTMTGYLVNCVMPGTILADGESVVKTCAQLRDENGHIMKLEGKEVSFYSTDQNILVAKEPYKPESLVYAHGLSDGDGLACVEFVSAGNHDDNNLGEVGIVAGAEFFTTCSDSTVTAKTVQIWPMNFDLTASPETLSCNAQTDMGFAINEVKITAQLLDGERNPIPMAGRTVVFSSQDTRKLVAADGTYRIEEETDYRGVAEAIFYTVDCKTDGSIGSASVLVQTISGGVGEDGVSKTVTAKIVKPKGVVPDAINVYTDQTLGVEAKPFIIAADGESWTELTAQLCEKTGTGEERYCNPVKKKGVELEFKVEDSGIVHKDGAPYNEIYATTDEEGTATVRFHSAGTIYGVNTGCTKIHVVGIGSMLDSTEAEVCAVKNVGLTPNAIWVWAEPAYITADGISHTKALSQLYWCTPKIISECGERKCTQKNWKYSADGPIFTSGTTDYSTDYCKPVLKEGTTVKFESRDPEIVTGRFGEIIYNTTDELGRAEAEFYSAGSLEHNFENLAEIEVYTLDMYEDIAPLNKLKIHAEEKTWPWCIGEGYGLGSADANDDGIISNIEILQYIGKWYNHQVDDGDLLLAIAAWANQ